MKEVGASATFAACVFGAEILSACVDMLHSRNLAYSARSVPLPFFAGRDSKKTCYAEVQC